MLPVHDRFEERRALLEAWAEFVAKPDYLARAH